MQSASNSQRSLPSGLTTSRPRDVMLVPRGAEHYIEVTDGPCVNLDVFVPPRADYAHLTAWVHGLAAATELAGSAR